MQHLEWAPGGGVIDNATSGGIFAEVDIDSGIVISQGYNMKGDTFLVHPDTGTIIPGFKVPLWNECLKLVSEAVKLVDGVSLIGWDIAVSKEGPTIVEVNIHPSLFLIQMPNGHGIREKILC